MKKYYITVVDKKVSGGVVGRYVWNALTDSPIEYYVRSKSFKVYDKRGKLVDKYGFDMRF